MEKQVVVTIFLGVSQQKTGKNLLAMKSPPDIDIKPQWFGDDDDGGLVGIGIVLDNIQDFGNLDLEKIRQIADTKRERLQKWLTDNGIQNKPEIFVTSNIW